VDRLIAGSATEAFTSRLARRRETVERLNGVDATVAYLRLCTFGIAVVLGWVVWRGTASAWLLLPPVAVFIALVIYHDRVLRARDSASRAIVFYERGLARLEDRWIGIGEPGDRFRDDDHLYANDLDLFGPGSLFELLSVARTRSGEDALAAWLKAPAAPDEISGRHAAVQELAPAVDLREALFLAGTDARAVVHGDALVTWAAADRIMRPAWMRAVTVGLSIAMAATIAWYFVSSDLLPFELAILVQSSVGWAWRARVEHALHAADRPARDLDVLSHLLETLERQTFSAPRLVALRRRLDTQGREASTAIRRLHRLMEMHDWEHNAMFLPIALIVQWGTHLAWAIESWRARHPPVVGCA
jgi:hypothetical protein